MPDVHDHDVTRTDIDTTESVSVDHGLDPAADHVRNADPNREGRPVCLANSHRSLISVPPPVTFVYI